jgi:penicillin-binding protein 1A
MPATGRRRPPRGNGPTPGSVAVAAVAIALAIGALGLALVQALSTDLPSLEQLETYRPRLITKVLGSDGSVIKQFYTERRVQVPLNEISPYLVEAVLATEDRRFYSHWGVDPIGIARAIVVNLATMSRTEGASTLTQHLARHLYLHLRKTWSRKIREMITAVQIERTYAKDEILQMYFTQMYFGHGSYGIQSAANFYFGVSAGELTLPESALLVGLLKSPNYYTPFRRPNEALRRRNTVLRNMMSAGYISESEYEWAKRAPIDLAEPDDDDLGIAPYYTEWVRRQLEDMRDQYGFDYYRDGLTIETALDPIVQEAAEVAVDSHMTVFQRQFDARFRRSGLRDWLLEAYTDSLREAGFLPAEDDTAEIEFTDEELELQRVHEDSVRSLVSGIMQDTSAVDSILKQYFTVQVAFVALDPQTGDVWAMIGGRDFHESKWNRAVQMARQPGSVFKPFVYTTAIDNGIYANHRVLNMVQPLLMGDGTWWRPENYNTLNRGEYVSLRYALKRSLNNVTVRMVAGEDRIVPVREVIRYARRMGITTRLAPYPAMALGSNDVIPIDVVQAFGVFASGGVRCTPRSVTRIQDRNGQEIATWGVQREVVLSEETAAIMTDLLQGVVNEGTGGSSRWRWGFRYPAAGKTGTTNNFNNAWFVGFTPKIVAGVWVGFDDPKTSLGQGMSGASAALPIWAIFMNEVHRLKRWGPTEFELPVGVVKVSVCEDSGMKAGPYCPHVYEELFRRGDEPFEACDLHSAAGGGW